MINPPTDLPPAPVDPTGPLGVEVNDPAVDRFTLGHAAVGFAYRRLGLGLGPAVFLALAWELAERPLKDRWPGAFPHPSQDSAENSLIDVAAVLGGWVLGG